MVRVLVGPVACAPSACLSLEKVLATCGFDVLDMVPVRRQNFDYKLDLLRSTGRHLASVLA